MPGLFVVGTDTAVGKTTIACALAIAARRAAIDVGVMKPVESGCARAPDGALLPADALALSAAIGDVDELALVCPFRLEAPVAPGIAAQEEGIDVDFEEIERCFRLLSTRHRGGVLVEGAGGLLVPLDPAFLTVADLATRLSLPVVIVARNRLGTINQTALTVEALATRGIECRGVILNGTEAGDPPEQVSNARAIAQLADVPILATLPHVPGLPEIDRSQVLSRRLEQEFSRDRKVDLAGLFA